jgi:hypothetical protein
LILVEGAVPGAGLGDERVFDPRSPEEILGRRSGEEGVLRHGRLPHRLGDRKKWAHVTILVRFTLAAALALITPALFSHRTPPNREKRERLALR